MKDSTVAIIGIALVVLVLAGIALLNHNINQKAQSYIVPYMYTGEVNASWVQSVPYVGLSTNGVINGSKLYLYFMPGDIEYARNQRAAYMEITLNGPVRDIVISGIRENYDVPVSVDTNSIKVVETIPMGYKDSIILNSQVFPGGSFRIEIPIDTYQVPVSAIYLGMDFVLTKQPAQTIQPTQVYEIQVSAMRAGVYKPAVLYVYAAYNVTK